VQMDQALAEVATRSPILLAQGKKNLVLRKLEFQHGNPAVPDGAVQITDSSGVLVEDCGFWWNNWDGFDVLVSNDVTIRRASANHNGGSGLGGYKLKRLLIDTTDSSFNNWRGAQGQFFGWAVAGGKFGAIHDGMVSRHRALANQSRGLWFDYDNVNVSIEQAGLYNNKTDGIFIEANAGPVAIRNSLIAGNVEGSGVLGSNSSDVTIKDSEIWANGRAQIGITGVDSRQVSNWETGASVNVRPERWSILSTLIWASTTAQAWLETPDWPAFYTTLNSRSNVWSRPVDPRAFGVGSRQLALFDWQQLTSMDLDSTAYIR
jgi:Right handed beta helix region